MADEYISREAAKEKLCSMCRWEGTSNCEECEHPIYDIHAADVAPVRHGWWMVKEESGCAYYVCSCCDEFCATWVDGHPMGIDMRNAAYCPNCGAKMDGGET